MLSFKKIINELPNNAEIRLLNNEELAVLKMTLLACYKDVNEVCKRYNLKLLVGGGTALGTIRHRGYIPWDDDFDLLMYREDYEIFKKVFNRELGEKYILNAPNYEGRAENRFPKILIKGTKFVELGEDKNNDNNKIKVDLFILENIPENIPLRLFRGMYCTILMAIAGSVDIYEKRHGALKTFMSQTKMGAFYYNVRLIIGSIFSFKACFEWLNMVDSVCHYHKKSEYLGIPTGRKHYFGEIFKRNVFFPVASGDFEGLEVSLPHNWDKYLVNLYGDYMVMPPPEKREKHYITEISFSGDL